MNKLTLILLVVLGVASFMLVYNAFILKFEAKELEATPIEIEHYTHWYFDCLNDYSLESIGSYSYKGYNFNNTSPDFSKSRKRFIIEKNGDCLINYYIQSNIVMNICTMCPTEEAQNKIGDLKEFKRSWFASGENSGTGEKDG